MCGYRKICVTYVDPWFPYEEEWLVYHVSWDCTRNPQRPEAISMNAFDKVHEYGEGGAGQFEKTQLKTKEPEVNYFRCRLKGQK